MSKPKSLFESNVHGYKVRAAIWLMEDTVLIDRKQRIVVVNPAYLINLNDKFEDAMKQEKKILERDIANTEDELGNKHNPELKNGLWGERKK